MNRDSGGVSLRPLAFSGEPYALLFWTVFAFWILMEANASRSKRARRNSKASARDRGSLWLIVILFWIGLSLSFSLCYLLPKAAIPGNRRMLFFLGISLMLAGIAFRWHAMSVLGKFFTVDVAVHSDHALVQSGPYRYIRHPSYTGELITQVGFGLALGNWTAFFALLLFMGIAYAYRISIEEAALATALGAPYQEYNSRTSRLIPFVF
jgi:protein-S-isoprenylcysteine O-methyltransferase Ste14